MDLLARREYGIRELEQKLIQKGCPREIAAVAVDGLKRDGLVSDERFAESLVQNRRERGYGPLRIERELQEKGIAHSVIDQWLNPRDSAWLDVLREVHRRKYGAMAPESYQERARRARFLQSRGFSAEQVMKVLKADEFD
jgi:regulatory protein